MASAKEKKESDEEQTGTAASDKEHETGLFSKCIKSRLFKRANVYNCDLPVHDLELSNLNVDGKCNKMQFGNENPHRGNKVIMMVGETGSGKTTLINALINYILGVKWEDKYRYRLIKENTGRSESQSQTSLVSIYQINHIEEFTIPYSLTIIDTPGLGSTEGIEQDKITAQQFQDCLNPHWGVDSIDAICFVVKASVNRLTTMQKYVIDSIVSMFGKDIKNNILICATFADHAQPKVIQALIDAQIPCVKKDNIPLYFKFNNSALYTQISNESEDEDDAALAKILYRIGKTSSRKLFMTLGVMAPQSLFLTKEVLRERKTLEIIIEGLLPRIQEVTLKQHELAKIQQLIQRHEKDIKNNRNFEYDENEIIKQRKNLWGHAINCHECNSTCHYPCFVSFEPLKYLCEVFTWGSGCKLCGHPIRNHHHEDHIWVNEVVKKKKTFYDLKEKYEKACKEKASNETLSVMLSREIKEAEDMGIQLIGKAANCIQRLREISLMPYSLSASDYVDLLITTEQHDAKPGYKERIKSLKNVRRSAKKLEEIEKMNSLVDTYLIFK